MRARKSKARKKKKQKTGLKTRQTDSLDLETSSKSSDLKNE